MSGYWIDNATGELVSEPPERGRQLVAPGEEPSSAVQRVIDALEAAGKVRKAPKKTAAKKRTARKKIETATEPTSDIETAEA